MAFSPGIIGTIPQGLLSLLALKQTGQNPLELNSQVQPSIDLTAWYVQRLVVDLNVSGSSKALATATPGFFTYTTNPLVVPANQTWWVDNYTIFGNLLPAETLRMVPALESTTLGPTYLLAADVADTVTARNRMLAVSARGFWAGPGTAFAVGVFDVLTAATITVAASVRGVALLI